MKKPLPKAVSVLSRPISTYVTPSTLRRSLAPGSESTILEEMHPLRKHEQTPHKALWTALTAGATQRASSTIADSDDEPIDDEFPEEPCQEGGISGQEAADEADATAGASTSDEDVVAGEAEDTEKRVLDDRPVTKMDRELYIDQWHAAGRPMPIEDYVRHRRASVKLNEDGESFSPHACISVKSNILSSPHPRPATNQLQAEGPS